MKYFNIIILCIFLGSLLVNTTSAASDDKTFDEKNKTLIIHKKDTKDTLMTVRQISVEPDLTNMEEVFEITPNEDYTFKKDKDFNIFWKKSIGKKDIKDIQLEILEPAQYEVTMPDFELIEKNMTFSNIQSITNVTDIYEVNPWYLDWGANSKEKWNITFPGGTGTIGFFRNETTSTDPLNITFFWYENEITGSHQETRYLDEWKPFSPAGRTIKKGESIVVKITFQKDAEKGKFSIKTIPQFAGIEEEGLTWWNASWDYRIDNPISNGKRPYQISLYLSNSIGTSNATHVFFNGHSKMDFTDIRFTLNNATALPYWIDEGTGKVWVNVTANGTVNLYYGNPSAIDSSNGMKTFEFFDDFEPESWQKKQKLPVPHADQAGAVLNGKVYTIGGYDVSYTQPVAFVWEYNPATNSYTQKANLNFAKWGLACTGYSSNIYCFGGSPNYNTEKYDPSANTWTTLPNLPPVPLQNQGLSVVSGGGFIYLFRGGYLYKYTPSSDTYTLLSSATPQSFTNWPSMAFYNNEIYILGGYSSTVDGGINYVQIYNINNNVWRNGASMPIGLYGTLRENPVVNGKIYILQGQGLSSNTDFFSRYWVYNISRNSWNWGELGYWDADGVSGGVIGNKIYTFGGRRGHGADDRGTDFAGVLDTNKKVENKWIDVITGSWREDFSSLQNGFAQYQPTVQIRTSRLAVNANNKVISKMKYSSGSTGYGGLILQSNNLGVPNNNGYLDPRIDITANMDALEKQTGSSITLLGSRALASPDVWHTYTSYYTSSSIRSTRDGAGEIISNDGTYRGGYIQAIKTMGFKLLIDYIAVARYVTPEPVWARWGAESDTNGLDIISWSNNKTNDRALSLTINVNEAVRFNATANQVITTWNWYKDGIGQNNNLNNFATSWSTAGTKTIKVKGTNSNGTTGNLTWSITVVSPTRISFIYPTPANGAIINKNYAFINTTVSGAATSFIDWNRSLIGWWRFNNEAGENSAFFKDWSSWGNNGACSGIYCPLLTSGKFGKALGLDGSNDYVDVPNSASLNPSKITLEAWFYANSGSLANQKPLIQKPFTSHVAPYYQYMLSLADTAGNPRSAEFYLAVNGVMQSVEVNNLGYNYSKWHYLAGTYNGLTMTMYLDGVAVGTTPIVGTITPYNTILEFGAYPNRPKDPSHVFNGKLDEIRIHKRALSPGEIKASYNAGIYRLYNNFTNLPVGVYNYMAYAQALSGNVNKTEMRSLTLT